MRFGRLTVLKRASDATNTYGRPIARWAARCECGKSTIVRGIKLTGGVTQSCGCLHRERFAEARRTHGLRRTREYNIWAHIKNRCLNPADARFHLWGGRGITICDEWRDNFLAFYADMGECPPGMSIDRIDNDRGYEPGNCRWATPSQQSNNLRTVRRLTHNGKTATLTEWAAKWGCSRDAIKLRLKRGQSFATVAEALGE